MNTKHQKFAYLKKRNGKFRATASNKSVDRDGDIIEPLGINGLEHFQKNPILLFGHDHSKPIGRVEEIQITDSEISFTPVFASTELAKEVETLYKEKVLNAFSIGFMIHAAEPIEGSYGRKITSWELLEVSAVSVPANREALAKSLKTLDALVGPVAAPTAAPAAEQASSSTETPEASPEAPKALPEPAPKYGFNSIPEGEALLRRLKALKKLNGVYEGTTDPAEDGHTHSFLVKFQEGEIVLSMIDGHGNKIKSLGKTDIEQGHVHSWTLPAIELLEQEIKSSERSNEEALLACINEVNNVLSGLLSSMK